MADISMVPHRWLAAPTPALAVMVLVAMSHICAHAQGCGVHSAFDLCSVTGREVRQEQLRAIVESYGAEEASMLDVVAAAQELGLRLDGREMAFAELIQGAAPSIMHLESMLKYGDDSAISIMEKALGR